MLCEKCHLRPATVSYHQVVNGEEEWLYLCDECADSYDFSNIFEKRMSDFSSFVQNLFGAQLEGRSTELPSKKRCPVCKRSFDDIAKTGKLGCDHCYSVFREELQPTLEKLHGPYTVHCGKVPKNRVRPVSSKERIAGLKEELRRAVEAQAYEEAARLRDQIAALEKQEQEEEK